MLCTASIEDFFLYISRGSEDQGEVFVFQFTGKKHNQACYRNVSDILIEIAREPKPAGAESKVRSVPLKMATDSSLLGRHERDSSWRQQESAERRQYQLDVRRPTRRLEMSDSSWQQRCLESEHAREGKQEQCQHHPRRMGEREYSESREALISPINLTWAGNIL